MVIAPSNPPLSIWPILAVDEIAVALKRTKRVMAVSPLFGGRALKGPADRVMASLGLPPGNAGVVSAYEGILDDLFIDSADRADRGELAGSGVSVHARSTLIAEPEQAMAFAARIVELL